MKQYFFNILISIDQFFNTLLMGNPDETISSRMGKKVRENKCFFCKIICNLLGKLDKNHCKNSIEDD